MGKFTFEAGALLKRPARNYLNECIFNEMNITYIEQKYFLSSTFIVKGDDDDIKKIIRTLRRYEN